MSYGFNMFFCHAKSIEEAMCIGKDIVKKSCSEEKMKNEIQKNEFFIPSIRGYAKPNDTWFCQTADRYWLYSLFNYRFVYWAKYQLLGLVREECEAWPSQSHTDKPCSVYFQNSCDQDYEFSEWLSCIPFFAGAVKKYKALTALPAEDVYAFLKAHNAHVPDEDDEEEEKERKERTSTPLHSMSKTIFYVATRFFPFLSKINMVKKANEENGADEYYIRSALYAYIFDTLELNDWLYGRNNDVFERFSINGMDTSELAFDMSLYLNRYVNTQLNQIYNKESCIIPVVLEGSANAYLFRYDYDKYGNAKELHVKEVISQVIDDYLDTEDGKTLASRFNGRLPYEEVLEAIPGTFFAKYHLFPLKEREYFTRATTYRYDEVFEVQHAQ